MAYVNADLVVGLFQLATGFQVYQRYTSYHLHRGRSGYIRIMLFARLTIQCFKVIWRGKKFHMDASKASFQKNEAHFSEAAFFMS